MLSWPPSPDAWRACLKDGDIIVVLMPIEDAIARARDAARRRCAELLEAFPGCFASRSATAGLAAVALEATARIGVDVEHIDPRFTPDDELLEMALDAAERATYARQEQHRFQRLWTCKESALKAAGAGLALLPASVHLGWDTEDWTCVDFDARASTVHVRSIASPPGFAAAVATLGAPRGVQVLTLD